MYLTLAKLIELTPEELARVESICREDGKWRCETVGIYDLKYEKRPNSEEYVVEWSDSDGNPTVWVEMDEKINRSCYGNYEFTLKLPKKKDS